MGFWDKLLDFLKPPEKVGGDDQIAIWDGDQRLAVVKDEDGTSHLLSTHDHNHNRII